MASASAQPEITFDDVKQFLIAMEVIDRDNDITQEDLTADKFKELGKIVQQKKQLLQDKDLRMSLNDNEKKLRGFYILYGRMLDNKNFSTSNPYDFFIKEFQTDINKMHVEKKTSADHAADLAKYQLHLDKITPTTNRIDKLKPPREPRDPPTLSDEHKQELKAHMSQYTAKAIQNHNTEKELSDAIHKWCAASKTQNILIIDYENYYRDESLSKLKLLIKSNNIDSCIVISKRPIRQDFQSICERMFLIETNGIQLSKPEIIFERGAATKVRTDEAVRHLFNGCDDLMLLFSFEKCTEVNNTPIIYSKDMQIKIDLLQSQQNPAQPYYYKDIPPFMCSVTIVTRGTQSPTTQYSIEPSRINLTGNRGNFDNFYNEFNPQEDKYYYLQKYLKYKNKYMQLKKSIN